MNKTTLLLLIALASGTANVSGAVVGAAELSLTKGDHVCLVGNALGERMQHHNWWETSLHQRFPDHELVVRNLCFPGDEPLHRIRSMNFGSPDDHLAHSKADVILYFFGFNESFAGERGLETFKADMGRLVADTRRNDYSGRGPPRIVLVSPIAFQNLRDPDLPDGAEQNRRLALYTGALREVAEEQEVGFVDLFTPTRALFERSGERLTLNGAHLNDAGYRALAPILMRGLFGDHAETPPNEALRRAVDDKNFHWWHRYRAVNGYSIYGARGQAGSDGTYDNTDVMERERAILDQMTANRDRRVWDIARGRPVPEHVDDSNTLPFIEPKSNVGGTNDPNRRAGKLGSLDYLSAEEQQKLFRLAPGYRIELVASEERFPELSNPVALNFDNRGRLWVSTMPSYPHWKPKSTMDDKLLILEDDDGDGRADACKVFAGGLHQPTGFEIGRGGAYVAQQPDILFLKDTDGDDRADVRVRQLVGFDSADSHHGIAAFEWGPGGGLYFQEGTFKYSQVESPYGLTRLHEAGVWRYDPRTERFGVHVSMSFANPWGHVFDRWGQNFIADASPGRSYWAAPISGRIDYPLKHPGGSQHRRLASQTGGSPDYQFPTFYPQRTRPSAGCELVSSRHFPPEAQGNFLLTNCIVERAVLQHVVREEGSGFVGTEIEPIVSCQDGNFRPVDLQFAPDGSLYIVDWHNALIGHLQHNLRDPNRDHSHGRVWRVTYEGRPLLDPPVIAGASVSSLLELLKAPEDRTRYRARRELAGRSTSEVIPEARAWVERLDRDEPEYQHHLLEALWLHQTHNVIDESLLDRLLESPDHRARAAATRVLSFWHDRLDDPLRRIRPRIDDAHPRVRLEAVRACSFVRSPDSIEVALDCLNHDMDDYLLYALNETLRSLESEFSAPSSAHAAHGGHEHHHASDAGDEPPPPAPLVLLDKSPRIVEFQLDRLSSSQLLLIDREDGDRKYAPVHRAILLRSDVSRQDREAALSALSRWSDEGIAGVVLDAVEQLDWSDSAERRVVEQLTSILLRRPAEELSPVAERFRDEVEASGRASRAVAMAGLITLGRSSVAWSVAESSSQARLDFLTGIRLVPDEKRRVELRERVLASLDESHPVDVRRAAIGALAFIPAEPSDTFRRLAPLVRQGSLRAAVVRSLSLIPEQDRPADAARDVVAALMTHAEGTRAARRTTPAFLDSMHLVDQLLALLPVEDAREYRRRLREVAVRVVRIDTVEEEMRYDTPYFAVEAGRPVQLVLRNEDLMSHNLVIAAPGKLRDVAAQAAALPPTIDDDGRQYVPRTSDVLWATRMVPAGGQDVLTFTAPEQPGEYPYVCTFPNHWMRMYGVMVVVPDLDAWRADPHPPADPLGITRPLVKNWTMEDLRIDPSGSSLEGRGRDIGRRIFEEATCLRCHKMGPEGGAVGPDLTDVLKRHQGDVRSVLREIIDPSHKIDPKYSLHNVVTADGRIISGIVTQQDARSITVIANPEDPRPQVIPRSEIDELVKSSTSMMPKGLMDRYTEQEILELLAFLTSP